MLKILTAHKPTWFSYNIGMLNSKKWQILAQCSRFFHLFKYILSKIVVLGLSVFWTDPYMSTSLNTWIHTMFLDVLQHNKGDVVPQIYNITKN